MSDKMTSDPSCFEESEYQDEEQFWELLKKEHENPALEGEEKSNFFALPLLKSQ